MNPSKNVPRILILWCYFFFLCMKSVFKILLIPFSQSKGSMQILQDSLMTPDGLFRGGGAGAEGIFGTLPEFFFNPDQLE